MRTTIDKAGRIVVPRALRDMLGMNLGAELDIAAVDGALEFASWHEHHEPARAALAQRPGVVAHSALETYSVLTRVPEPHRVPGDAVATFLARAFDLPLTLDRVQR